MLTVHLPTKIGEIIFKLRFQLHLSQADCERFRFKMTLCNSSVHALPSYYARARVGDTRQEHECTPVTLSDTYCACIKFL